MRLRQRPFTLTRRTRTPWLYPEEWSEIAWALLITCAIAGMLLGIVSRWAR